MAGMLSKELITLRQRLDAAVQDMRPQQREAQQIWDRTLHESRLQGDPYAYYPKQASGVFKPVKMAAPAVFDPNKIEALNVDLEALAGLWSAKYGTTWVRDKDFTEGAAVEAFWFHAFKRLRLNSRFESYDAWSKLKEET